jgi:manganese/zinc/iron transport system permease protein
MPELTYLDGWIILTGILCALACALPGCYLVLRKMSMMGDAISHAVLPGLAVAFLLTESRASLPMFIGAAVVGVLTAVFTQWIRSAGKVDEGASMGVVFTALFAIGLILIVRAADHVDLDPGCVLYGAIEMTPLDTINPFGLGEVPRAAAVLATVLGINAAVILLFYKELKITSFDPALATALGISARWMHYLLMTLVAVTAVAAFESVGSILVVAMLVVPAAAAYLLTQRLSLMLVLAMVIGALSAVTGHLAALIVPGWFGYGSTSTAGMMAVMAGVFLALVALFAPRSGVLMRLLGHLQLVLRIRREDILGQLYRAEEQSKGTLAAAELRDDGHRWASRVALRLLARQGLIASADGRWQLTAPGREVASELLRSHRLWQDYLSESLNVAGDHVHDAADQLEHIAHLAPPPR